MAGQSTTTILQEIYTTMGCTSLQPSSLPTLLFHLSKDIKSCHFILDETGWDQLQQDWGMEVDQMGDNSLADLILLPKVSMHFHDILFTSDISLVSQRLGKCQEAQEVQGVDTQQNWQPCDSNLASFSIRQCQGLPTLSLLTADAPYCLA